MMNPLKMKQQATELLKDYLDSIHARLEKMNDQLDKLNNEISINNKLMADLLRDRMDMLILEIKENNSAIRAMVMLNNEPRTPNIEHRNTCNGDCEDKK